MNCDDLRALIERTGLAHEEFARHVVGCAPLTLLRWLEGELMPESTTDWLVRLRSVTATRTSVHLVIDREDCGAARQSLREIVAWSREHEDQSARLPPGVIDDPNVEDETGTPLAETPLRCTCGIKLTDALAGLDHAATCGVRAAMPSRAALEPVADPVAVVAARLAAALTQAIETLGTEVKARAWLHRPSLALGVAPMQLLATEAGVREVLYELGRIDHGIPAETPIEKGTVARVTRWVGYSFPKGST